MEKLFNLKEHKTSIKTEVVAGIATFLTMAYIIVVNPGILSNTGMPFDGVLFATVLVAAISSILMGLYAKLPIALAPGMGINAIFTYDLVMGMKISWETALGVVFLSGIIFIILSISKIRTIIVKAIPSSLRFAVAAGIGLFLTLIGLKNVGFIKASEATLVTFGGINAVTLLFLFGLLVTSILVIKKVKGSLILGIILTTVLAYIVSQVGWVEKPIVSTPEKIFAMPSLDVFFKLDIVKAFSISMIAPIFTLLFTDMFDSISTFVGVTQVANLMDKDGQPINVGKALLVDSISTTISGLFGTSSGTAYIESAAGVEEGGRTGLTAVVTGLLFLPFMFLSPLLGLIPVVASAPILVLIGIFMTRPLPLIDWKNFEEAIPAFLAIILIPLIYSITQGIIWGFLSYTAIKLLLGKFKDVHWMLYIVDGFAILALYLRAY